MKEYKIEKSKTPEWDDKKETPVYFWDVYRYEKEFINFNFGVITFIYLFMGFFVYITFLENLFPLYFLISFIIIITLLFIILFIYLKMNKYIYHKSFKTKKGAENYIKFKKDGGEI